MSANDLIPDATGGGADKPKKGKFGHPLMVVVGLKGELKELYKKLDSVKFKQVVGTYKGKLAQFKNGGAHVPPPSKQALAKQKKLQAARESLEERVIKLKAKIKTASGELKYYEKAVKESSDNPNLTPEQLKQRGDPDAPSAPNGQLDERYVFGREKRRLDWSKPRGDSKRLKPAAIELQLDGEAGGAGDERLDVRPSELDFTVTRGIRSSDIQEDGKYYRMKGIGKPPLPPSLQHSGASVRYTEQPTVSQPLDIHGDGKYYRIKGKAPLPPSLQHSGASVRYTEQPTVSQPLDIHPPPLPRHPPPALPPHLPRGHNYTVRYTEQPTFSEPLNIHPPPLPRHPPPALPAKEIVPQYEPYQIPQYEQLPPPLPRHPPPPLGGGGGGGGGGGRGRNYFEMPNIRGHAYNFVRGALEREEIAVRNAQAQLRRGGEDFGRAVRMGREGLAGVARRGREFLDGREGGGGGIELGGFARMGREFLDGGGEALPELFRAGQSFWRGAEQINQALNPFMEIYRAGVAMYHIGSGVYHLFNAATSTGGAPDPGPPSDTEVEFGEGRRGRWIRRNGRDVFVEDGLDVDEERLMQDVDNMERQKQENMVEKYQGMENAAKSKIVHQNPMSGTIKSQTNLVRSARQNFLTQLRDGNSAQMVPSEAKIAANAISRAQRAKRMKMAHCG